MPAETSEFITGTLYAMLFGLIGWAAFGVGIYGLIG